jgi:hypothetical protein
VKLSDSQGNPIDPTGYDEVRLNIVDVTGAVRTEYRAPSLNGYQPLTLNSDGVLLNLLSSETAKYKIGTIQFDLWLNDGTDTTPLAFPRTELAQITRSTI